MNARRQLRLSGLWHYGKTLPLVRYDPEFAEFQRQHPYDTLELALLSLERTLRARGDLVSPIDTLAILREARS